VVAVVVEDLVVMLVLVVLVEGLMDQSPKVLVLMD